MLKFRRILFFVIVSEFNCILNFIRSSSIVNDIKKRKREKFLSMIPKQIGSFSLILKNSEIESSIRTHDYITKTPRHTFTERLSCNLVQGVNPSTTLSIFFSSSYEVSGCGKICQ